MKNYFLTGAGAGAGAGTGAGAGLAAGAATAIGAATIAFLAFLAAFLAAFFSALAVFTTGATVSVETATTGDLVAEVCALAEEANNATTARISENFFMFFSKMIFINADFRSVFFLKIIIGL